MSSWFSSTRSAHAALQEALIKAESARDALYHRNDTYKATMEEAWVEMVDAQKLHASVAEHVANLAADKYEDMAARLEDTAEKIAKMSQWIGELESFIDDKRCDEAMLASVRPVAQLDAAVAPERLLDAVADFLKSRAVASEKNKVVRNALKEQRANAVSATQAQTEKEAGTTRQQMRKDLLERARHQAHSEIRGVVEGMSIPMPSKEELELEKRLQAL